MKNTKKNNKGFSLVELIVVVLIMAIIAVALAPQVMKWVNNSREASDIQTADAVVSAMQIALATPGIASGDSRTITLSGDSTNIGTVGESGFWNAVATNLGQSTVAFKSSGSVTLTIEDGGSITKEYSGFTSTDLDIS